MGLANPTHILVLAVIILLVFGSAQLPKIARSAGKHAREAKDGVSSFKQEFDHATGEIKPLADVVDTVRSANPRTIVRDAAKKAVSPSEGPKTPPKTPAKAAPKHRPTTPPRTPPRKP